MGTKTRANLTCTNNTLEQTGNQRLLDMAGKANFTVYKK